MTERKPPDETVGSFVERQIREAQARGEFDDLPGAGRPLADLHRPHDELWWVRRKMADEGLSYVPPGLQVRRDLEDARARIARARSEREVRRIVTETNALIREAKARTIVEGPAVTVRPLDEERTVRAWRAASDG